MTLTSLYWKAVAKDTYLEEPLLTESLISLREYETCVILSHRSQPMHMSSTVKRVWAIFQKLMFHIHLLTSVTSFPFCGKMTQELKEAWIRQANKAVGEYARSYRVAYLCPSIVDNVERVFHNTNTDNYICEMRMRLDPETKPIADAIEVVGRRARRYKDWVLSFDPVVEQSAPSVELNLGEPALFPASEDEAETEDTAPSVGEELFLDEEVGSENSIPDRKSVV